MSVTVNIDFEINYLPPYQVDYGHDFLIELANSKLSEAQKNEVKIQRFVFLKNAAKAVLKQIPPAPDLLFEFILISSAIYLFQ